MATQVAVHGFNGANKGVDRLIDHLLRFLLRHGKVGNITVNRHNASHALCFVAKGRAGREEIPLISFDGQSFGKAGKPARLVYCQRMRYKTARQIRPKFSMGAAA